MTDPKVEEATPEESAQIESTVGGEDLGGSWIVVS